MRAMCPAVRRVGRFIPLCVALGTGCAAHHTPRPPSPSVYRRVSDADAIRVLDRALDSIPLPPLSTAQASSPVSALDGPGTAGPACARTIKRVRWWEVRPAAGQGTADVAGNAWLWLKEHPPPHVGLSAMEGTGRRLESLRYFLSEPGPYQRLSPSVVLDVEADGDAGVIRATAYAGMDGCVSS